MRRSSTSNGFTSVRKQYWILGKGRPSYSESSRKHECRINLRIPKLCRRGTPSFCERNHNGKAMLCPEGQQPIIYFGQGSSTFGDAQADNRSIFGWYQQGTLTDMQIFIFHSLYLCGTGAESQKSDICHFRRKLEYFHSRTTFPRSRIFQCIDENATQLRHALRRLQVCFFPYEVAGQSSMRSRWKAIKQQR